MNTNFLEITDLVLFGLNGITFLGLVIISILFFQLKKHYKRLTGKADKKSLQKVLDEILDVQKDYAKKYDEVKKTVEKIERDGAFHLQKIGFKRFNPFGDTGGDQSFSTALMDKNKNGIVFSALHSRDTTRVYAKTIEKGKTAEMPLSKEERQVIANAKDLKT